MQIRCSYLIMVLLSVGVHVGRIRSIKWEKMVLYWGKLSVCFFMLLIFMLSPPDVVKFLCNGEKVLNLLFIMRQQEIRKKQIFRNISICLQTYFHQKLSTLSQNMMSFKNSVLSCSLKLHVKKQTFKGSVLFLTSFVQMWHYLCFFGRDTFSHLVEMLPFNVYLWFNPQKSKFLRRERSGKQLQWTEAGIRLTWL